MYWCQYLLYSCPTECRLSNSQSPWQCAVSLRFTTSHQVRNEDFGPVIYDKAQVEDRIRRAQRAILNPSKPSKQFLEDTEDVQDSELSFSNNCVSLQISGPDVADLSFCDLPGTSFVFVAFIFLFLSWFTLYIQGLIANVSSSRKKGGGNNDISLVENLVTSYIKKPSCIILLTVTCESELTYLLLCFTVFLLVVSDKPISKTRALIVSQNCMIQRENALLVCVTLWKFSFTALLRSITSL